MSISSFPLGAGLRNFKSGRFGLASNTQTFTSRFTGATQTEEWAGARWQASFNLPPLTSQEAGAWKSFLVSLRGQSGRFYGFDPDYAVRGANGTPAGMPLVNGGSQSGVTLDTNGWTPNTRIFEPGDYFAFETTYGRELKMVNQAIDSDAAGNAQLVFEPPIRHAPVDDEAIIVDAPSCVIMLSSDVVGWDIDTITRYGISFEAVEVFHVT